MQAADVVALIRLIVTYLISSREPALRLLVCVVFLIPMPRLVSSNPSRDDAQHDREEALEAADLPHAFEHQQHHQQQLQQHELQEQQQQQRKEHEQQPCGEPPQPQGSQDSLHGSRESSNKGRGVIKSSSSSEPHTVVLVPPTKQPQVQQQEREQEEIVVRDTVPITSMMVLGSAILACSPGVLLAGQWGKNKCALHWALSSKLQIDEIEYRIGSARLITQNVSVFPALPGVAKYASLSVCAGSAFQGGILGSLIRASFEWLST